MNKAYILRRTAISDDGFANNIITYIQLLKNTLGKKVMKNMTNIQLGDSTITNAQVLLLQNNIRFNPYTKINFGVSEFVKRNTEYYKC